MVSPPRTPARGRVLDEKNHLMLQVLQDYGPYSPRKEYSCRSLPKPRSEDFVLRHNAQNIHDFKQFYSKMHGTLNRKPPRFTTNCPPTSPFAKRIPSPPKQVEAVWKEIKPREWVLTEYGVNMLIGIATPNNTPVPKTALLLPSIAKKPVDNQPFQERARVGKHKDLSKDEEFAGLVRLHHYSPRTTRSTIVSSSPNKTMLMTRPSTSGECSAFSKSPKSYRRPLTCEDGRYSFPLSRPSFSPPKNKKQTQVKTIPLMEIEPSLINFDVVHKGHNYQFPIKIRNFSTKQERFRVRRVVLKIGGIECATIHALYDKDKAKIAPGLHATLVLQASFPHEGLISGSIEIENPQGKCTMPLLGTVME